MPCPATMPLPLPCPHQVLPVLALVASAPDAVRVAWQPEGSSLTLKPAVLDTHLTTAFLHRVRTVPLLAKPAGGRSSRGRGKVGCSSTNLTRSPSPGGPGPPTHTGTPPHTPPLSPHDFPCSHTHMDASTCTHTHIHTQRCNYCLYPFIVLPLCKHTSPHMVLNCKCVSSHLT